jgi:hypothetical protein
MAKIKYMGPDAGVEAFGLAFSRGQTVDVPDEEAAKKLANNPCFQPADDAAKKLVVVVKKRPMLPGLAAAQTE